MCVRACLRRSFVLYATISVTYAFTKATLFESRGATVSHLVRFVAGLTMSPYGCHGALQAVRSAEEAKCNAVAGVVPSLVSFLHSFFPRLGWLN